MYKEGDPRAPRNPQTGESEVPLSTAHNSASVEHGEAHHDHVTLQGSSCILNNSHFWILKSALPLTHTCATASVRVSSCRERSHQCLSTTLPACKLQGCVHEPAHCGVHAECADFEHMVSLLPRDEEAMSSVSIHAHSHATVYSLPNAAVLRNLAERFPGVVARMAIFARRQQHARIRLQWQDMGSRFRFTRSHCVPARSCMM